MEIEVLDTDYKNDCIADIDLEINSDLVDTRGEDDIPYED